MGQLIFAWPTPPSYAAEDFILSQSNETAVTFLDSWPDASLQQAALLVGPASSGKTHLAKRWAARTQAIVIDKTILGTMPSAELLGASRAALLEDIHTVTNETALFHLLRHAETHAIFLLCSSRVTAAQLSFKLPDLRSRLLALPAAELLAPDEALLSGFLMKCFSDRQLRVGEDVIHYLTHRIERSFAQALALVERIERTSIETKREITIPLVKPLLQSA